jgi:EAL domain-containing protein (putative c-di-GMP-specific phosphodiesterase class I)
LSRGPEKTPWEDPTVLFEYARRKGAEAVVDLHAIRTAFSACEQVRPDLGFSVNVHASTLSRYADFVPRLVEHAVRSRIDLARLTVEIVEHSPALNEVQFLCSLYELRRLGVHIALDDIGIGHSNFRMIIDATPDCFKVDSYVARGIHADSRRRSVLASIISLANDMGSTVIVEGVEEPEELFAVRELGANLIQGFIFCKPMPLPVFINQELAIERAFQEKTFLLRPQSMLAL